MFLYLSWDPICEKNLTIIICIILLVTSGSQTPICHVLHSFVLQLAPAVSVLQLLKSGTLSLRLFECVPAMILSAINSRPTTSSWPSNPLSASSLAPHIRLWLTIVRVYKLYLLTYLLCVNDSKKQTSSSSCFVFSSIARMSCIVSPYHRSVQQNT